MKKTLTMILAALMAVLMLVGCVPQPAAATAESGKEQPVEVQQEPAEEMATLPNPMVEHATLAEMLAAVPNLNMKEAPEGATDVKYFTIDGEPMIGQVSFTFDGDEYTYRAAVCDSADKMVDISGIYSTVTATIDETTATDGGTYMLDCFEAGEGLATWFYEPTKCQYSIWTTTGCAGDHTSGQKIETVVDQLLPITSALDGSVLELPKTTMIPAVVAGTISGVVVELEENGELVINVEDTAKPENSISIGFDLNYLPDTAAAPGDAVTIEYAGDLTMNPQAVTIKVDTPAAEAPKAAVLYGAMLASDGASVAVQISSGSSYAFAITDNTVISAECNQNDKVKVTFAGNLADTPEAQKIEIVTDVPTPDNDDPKDKHLSGYVTKLSSKSVTVTTSSGHSYKFLRDETTVISGKYSLEKEAKVRVLYDGYASKSPVAREITVTAPPDPKPKTHKVKGIVTMLAGNALVIETSKGQEYSFLLAAPKISGDPDPDVGFTATVTFIYRDDGTMNVLKIKYTAPILYAEENNDGPVEFGSFEY